MTDSTLLAVHAWVIAAIDAVRWFWLRAVIVLPVIGLLTFIYFGIVIWKGVK